MGDGTERIEDDELLYRRIPKPWFDSSISPFPSSQTFRPNEKDISGLSLTRAKYISPEKFAELGRGKQYYIAILCAGDLRLHGIEVESKPLLPDQPGHSELPGLTWENHKNVEQEKWKKLMAEELCLEIKGPYLGNTCEGSG